MRCPVCRADVEQGPSCRRCRADLSLLFALEERRRHVLREAARALFAGQSRRAEALAEGAEALRGGTDALRVRAICHLLNRDFRQALKRHAQARET
jgi:hypothetical protein